MKEDHHLQNPILTAGRHISWWTDSASAQVLNPLKENIETDVVVVGGGLAGMSVAYCLAESGREVVLVEDGYIGSGETGRTTAHLVTALDDRYYHLQKIFGEEKTRLIAESHQRAIDFVEETVRKENIDCSFERVNGYLFLHPSDKKDSLEREFEAAKKAGVEISVANIAPGLQRQEKCLCFSNQGQFHPLKYLQGLAGCIEKKGGRIYTGTHASKINHEGIITSDGFSVKAKHIVVATNSPVNNFYAMFLKQYPYRTYVIGALVKKNLLPKALWWDTGNFNSNRAIPPYHYVRLDSYNEEYDLLISGGEDHPTGDTRKTKIPEEARYRLVENWTREHFPIGEIIYRWSGQVMEPMDGIAYIGRNPWDRKNVYIVTGDSGNGMTHCSFAGLLISDLINGKENKFEKLYKPSRFSLRESRPVLRQILNDFISYFRQMPNFKSRKEIESVKKGEGKIIGMQEEHYGVYRNNEGRLHIVSAKCTHVKCTLIWNNDELSWDCACHGSRFTYDGKVINGPANSDLPYYGEGENL
jgi:glycine/D-amino acid oxidase-like deaminating enzyme/nitrite reductase/ring-hydroxylating ferredoxin subunit